jgi:NAD(P)-dependent dehydrogenase (short-subunit alcohol dehydrogenase family)
MPGPRLDGAVALVTGSTSGLGKEIACRFAAEGAAVIVTGRDASRGTAVVETIGQGGGRAAFVGAELSTRAGCAELVRRAAEPFGAVGILVNNAVDARGDARMTDVTEEAWERCLRVTLSAAAWACAAALPAMRTHGGGAIVNVSSRAAERGTPGLAAYSAAKGGLNALTRQIATDYAADGVRCNSVTPGYVLHEERDRDLDATKRARLEGQHLLRLATAGDVAQAVLFLASPEAATITGIDLPVSGGSSTARALRLG